MPLLPFDTAQAPIIEKLKTLVECYSRRVELRDGKLPAEEAKPLADRIDSLESEVLSATGRFAEFFDSFPLSLMEKRILFTLLVFEAFAELSERIGCGKSNQYAPVSQVLRLVSTTAVEELENRKYFSINATLVAQGVIQVCQKGDFREAIAHCEAGLDSRHVNFLLGDDNVYSSETFVRWEWSEQSMDAVFLPREIKEPILNFITNYGRYQKKENDLRDTATFTYGTAPCFLFTGESGVGKTLLAYAIANRMGRKVFTIKSANDDVAWHRALGQAFREARLQNGILFIDECDDLFHAGNELSRELLVQLEHADCIVILSTNNSSRLDPALERRILFKYEIPFPDPAARTGMWRRFLEQSHAELAPDITCELLGQRYGMPGGHIKNCVLYLLTQRQVNGGSGPISRQEIIEIANIFYERYLGGVGDDMDLPRIRFDVPPGWKNSGAAAFDGKAEEVRRHIVNCTAASQTLSRRTLTIGMHTSNLEVAAEAAAVLAIELDRPFLAICESRLGVFAMDSEARQQFRNFLDRLDHVRPVIIFIRNIKTIDSDANRLFRSLWDQSEEWNTARFFISLLNDSGKYLNEPPFDYVYEMGDTGNLWLLLQPSLAWLATEAREKVLAALGTRQGGTETIAVLEKRLVCERERVAGSSDPAATILEMLDEIQGMKRRSRMALFGNG